MTLRLDADDIDAIVDRLTALATDLHLDKPREEYTAYVSAGWSSSYDLSIKVTDPTMTGDRYRNELTEWSDANRERRKAREANA